MSKHRTVSKAEEHLPGGKMIRIKIEHQDFIEKVEISGDFSIKPENAIHEVERCLVDVEVESAEQGIADLIYDTLHDHHATVEGASAYDIARVVKKALIMGK
jgi:hypothetical protein